MNMMNETKVERINYLDGLKAVCIFLVIIAHTAYFPNDSVIGNFITTLTWVAVPCFMMITGALFHQKKEFNWKKYFLRLVKMYFVLCLWKIIYLVIGIIFNNVHYGIMEYVQYTFLFLDLEGVSYAHTWYIVAYLVVMFIYPITYYLFNNLDSNGKHTGRYVLAFVCLICLFDGIIVHEADWWFEQVLKLFSISKLPLVGIETMLPFTNYSNMIFYFILGAFIYEYREMISSKIKKYKYLLFAILPISAFVLMIVKYIECGSFGFEGFYVTIGYNRISTIMMSVCLYLIFYEFRNNMKMFNDYAGKYIGRNTLGIFYLHNMVILIFNNILFEHKNLMLEFIISIVVTILCTLLTILIKKCKYIKEIV